MARFILLGLVIAVFTLLFRAFFPSSSAKDGAAKDMVKDPNCGTYVPQSEALRKKVVGVEQFFCSDKCAEEYSRKNA